MSNNIEIKKSTVQLVTMVVAVLVVGVVLGSGITLAVLGTSFNSPTGEVVAKDPQPQIDPGQRAPSGPTINAKDLEDDDPFLGSANAPLTIVEFSDFQCPFCRRFYEQTLPQLKSQYIDTGKVKLVYRDFPLNFHPAAQPAAEAAECADDQGKFEEMHDKLFEEQSKLGQGTVQFTVDDIKSWARSVSGLDYTTWESCLDSGKYRAEVQKDLADGSAAGISGTPGFYVGDQLVSGAQPFSVFQQIIEAQL